MAATFPAWAPGTCSCGHTWAIGETIGYPPGRNQQLRCDDCLVPKPPVGSAKLPSVVWIRPSRYTTKCAECTTRIGKGRYCGAVSGVPGTLCAGCLTQYTEPIQTRRVNLAGGET